MSFWVVLIVQDVSGRSQTLKQCFLCFHAVSCHGGGRRLFDWLTEMSSSGEQEVLIEYRTTEITFEWDLDKMAKMTTSGDQDSVKNGH